MIESLCIAAATTVLLLALSMVSLLLPSAKRPAPARGGEESPQPQPIAEDTSRLLLELAVRARVAAFDIAHVPPPSEPAERPLLSRLIDAAADGWVGGRSGLFRRPRLEEAVAAVAADRPGDGWLLVAARWSCQAAWESAQGEVAVELAFRQAAGRWGQCIGAFAIPGELEARSVWFAVPIGEIDVASEACAAQWLRSLDSQLNEACIAETDHPAEAAASLKAWRCQSADALHVGIDELAGRFEHAEGRAAAAEWHWGEIWLPLEAPAAEPAADQAVTPPVAAEIEAPVTSPIEQSVQDEISGIFAAQTAEPAAEPVRDRRRSQPPEPEVEPEEQIAADLREVAKTTAQGLQKPVAKADPKDDPAAAGPLNSDDIAKLFAAAEAAKG